MRYGPLYRNGRCRRTACYPLYHHLRVRRIPGYKDVLLNARPEDVRIIHSPVGMPGRALNTPLVQALAEGTRFPPRHCARCLKTCDPAKVPYCITHALIEAVKGNVEEGLFFCGANVGRLDRMRTVQELMDELVIEWSKINEACRFICRSGGTAPRHGQRILRSIFRFPCRVRRCRPSV